MTTPILNVENLHISYRVGRAWLPAVREFAMQVGMGEIHGIVGESGSGKSSVAAGLMRYLSPNGRIEAGSRIDFMGEDLLAKSPSEMRGIWGKRMKLIPQNPAAALNPSLKIGEQAAEGIRYNLGLTATQARAHVLEMFQKVQLIDPERIMERYPHQLSGGMQQRVLIAMGLISNPELLILDEPTTGLDVTTEAAILDLIRDLIRAYHGGAIYITHNLGVVAQLCDTVTIMYGGEIMVEGAVKDIFTKPLHPYTIGLLKSMPRFGQTKQAARLPSIEGHPPSLANLPRGCVFADRCPVAIEKCHQQKPPLERTPDGRFIRCFRWEEIRAGDLMLLDDIQMGVGESPEMPALLTVTNLTKHYPTPRSLMDRLQGVTPPPIRALDRVNLGIQRGRTLGLVGESGSGKTTLSRVIIGLTERTEGKLNLLGAEVENHARQRSADILAKMQMIFQNPQESLNPYHSIGYTLSRPLIKLRGFKRAEAEAEARRLLAAVNLRAEYFNRYPNELSGGEKQRVAIARAFASDPDLIIADEPVSALDVSVQSAILNLLAQLQAEHDTAYLFISHDLAVVGYLADYVAVMYLGQIMEVGYAWDVLDPPWHPYTEALISAIPSPDPRQKTERILLQGNLPSAQHVPSGCRFHTRCPRKIGSICETDEPPWQDAGEDHFIRCHIPLADLLAAQKTRTEVE